jgi:hypothetical protein
VSGEVRYRIGPLVQGPMFDQGRRWVVVGPGDVIMGYYETEEEAQRKADALNRQAYASGGSLRAARRPLRSHVSTAAQQAVSPDAGLAPCGRSVRRR